MKNLNDKDDSSAIKMEDLLCPSCGSDKLTSSKEFVSCAGCNSKYKRMDNIIDFRGLEAVNDSDVDFILSNYEKSYFEIIKLNLERTILNEDLKMKYYNVDIKVLERNQEKVEIIKELVPLKAGGCFGELGCGRGSSIFAMSKIADHVIGVDISFSSLLLANKILLENNIKNVLLLCCDISKLPLKSDIFDLIFSTDVIEHVNDQSGFIKTGYDLLKENGSFIFNTPNRFSLFSPEPHTNVWFVGLLPRALMKKYVFMVKKVDYVDITLLSYFDLKKLMGSLNLKGKIMGLTKAELSGVSKNSAKCKIVRDFPFGLGLMNCIFKIFLPSYSIVIRKELPIK